MYFYFVLKILSVPEHGEDIESATGLVEGPPNPEDALDSEEEMSSMDLEDFLSQFVLIKTPYGYILAKAPTSGEMVRVRRGRQQVIIRNTKPPLTTFD